MKFPVGGYVFGHVSRPSTVDTFFQVSMMCVGCLMFTHCRVLDILPTPFLDLLRVVGHWRPAP